MNALPSKNNNRACSLVNLSAVFDQCRAPRELRSTTSPTFAAILVLRENARLFPSTVANHLHAFLLLYGTVIGKKAAVEPHLLYYCTPVTLRSAFMKSSRGRSCP